MGSQVKFLFHLPYFGRSVKDSIAAIGTYSFNPSEPSHGLFPCHIVHLSIQLGCELLAASSMAFQIGQNVHENPPRGELLHLLSPIRIHLPHLFTILEGAWSIAQSPWSRRCQPNTETLFRNQGTFFKLIKSSVVLSSFSCICCKVLDTSSIQESWFFKASCISPISNRMVEISAVMVASTRCRLVIMEWVASTRARISSKSTFTASMAAVKSSMSRSHAKTMRRMWFTSPASTLGTWRIGSGIKERMTYLKM